MVGEGEMSEGDAYYRSNFTNQKQVKKRNPTCLSLDVPTPSQKSG